MVQQLGKLSPLSVLALPDCINFDRAGSSGPKGVKKSPPEPFERLITVSADGGGFDLSLTPLPAEILAVVQPDTISQE